MYTYTASNLRPRGLWLLNDSSPFDDHSAYGMSGTSSGSPTIMLPLVSRASNSTVFSNTNKGQFESNVFQQGKEKDPFTIEGWFYPVNKVLGDFDPIQAFGNAGLMDGIVINGTEVSFIMKFTTASDSVITFDTQRQEAMYIVALHTLEKNELWINNEFAGSIALTASQQNDQYEDSDGFLYVGTTTGTQHLACNALAIYDRTLTAEEINSNFQSGRLTAESLLVPTYYGGTQVPLTLDSADYWINQLYDTDAEWDLGVTDLSIVNDVIYPKFSGSVSLAGTWTGAFDLEVTGLTSVYGLWVDWDGEGVDVDLSLNSTSWTSAERGIVTSLVPEGFDPTGETLYVRVTFPGGITDDESYLSGLQVVGIASGVVDSGLTRDVTYSAGTLGASIRHYSAPIEFRNDATTLFDGQDIDFAGDGDVDAPVLRTVEALVRLYEDSPDLNNDLGAVSNTYVDGVLSGSALTGEWALYHWVTSSNQTSVGFTIGGNAQIAHVAVYDTPLTQTQISEIIELYFGRRSLFVEDSHTIGVAMDTDPPKIYNYDWQILSSG